ncbi:MAG: molybdopterin molybdenumtransferase MoeA [Bacteroidetes bacterium]|nr:molybdopterin molybdenumtransferase MoeA [Bacteroidota bacterium]
MVEIEEALNRICSQKPEIKKTTQTVTQSLGYCLAEDIYAPFPLPPFDNSAMDGYALSGQVESYQIIGEVAAGSNASIQLKVGQAVRIFTGARIPEGAESVLMQEKSRVENGLLYPLEIPIPGKHIRRQGEELRTNSCVFESGHLLNAASLGILSSFGINHIDVWQKPRIHILVTGNELIQAGEVRQPGQIYESNRTTLKAALERSGFLSLRYSHVHDDLESIRQEISKILEENDLLLISGGISVGDYDFVQKALQENQVQEVFYKVNQKPGKPLWFGKKEDCFVFGLPGNPASSLTCFYMFVWPLLQMMQGANNAGLPKIKAKLQHSFEIKSERPVFLKAQLNSDGVHILDGQGSSMIYSLAHANALVFLNKEAQFNPGDEVECYLIP